MWFKPSSGTLVFTISLNCFYSPVGKFQLGKVQVYHFSFTQRTAWRHLMSQESSRTKQPQLPSSLHYVALDFKPLISHTQNTLQGCAQQLIENSNHWDLETINMMFYVW